MESCIALALPPSDLSLRDRLLAGVEGAVEELWCSYRAPLLAFVRRLVREHRGEDAEEVVGETFLRALQAMERFDDRQDMLAWLGGIARKVLLELRRRRRPSPLDPISPEAPVLLDERDPSEALEREEICSEVRALVDSLPARPRALLSMHYFDGVPLPEIARVRGLSEAAAWSALGRARKSLASALERRARERERERSVEGPALLRLMRALRRPWRRILRSAESFSGFRDQEPGVDSTERWRATPPPAGSGGQDAALLSSGHPTPRPAIRGWAATVARSEHRCTMSKIQTRDRAVDRAGYVLVSPASSCELRTRSTKPIVPGSIKTPIGGAVRRRSMLLVKNHIESGSGTAFVLGGDGVNAVTSYPLATGEVIELPLTVRVLVNIVGTSQDSAARTLEHG